MNSPTTKPPDAFTPPPLLLAGDDINESLPDFWASFWREVRRLADVIRQRETDAATREHLPEMEVAP
jgi:hypothetical protein